MVLSLINLAATVPLIATSTLQFQDNAQKHQNGGTETTTVDERSDKTQKCHLLARASARMSDTRKQQLQDKLVALKDGKLFLLTRDQISKHGAHPFTGYFLPYPKQDSDGVVSTINSENMLNWIYIDANTYEVKYGIRVEADEHMTVPMGLLRLPQGEERLLFNGWEGFVAVEEQPNSWALYLDKDDNGLKGKVDGKQITEVELVKKLMDEPVSPSQW